jgi:hypothetical protein
VTTPTVRDDLTLSASTVTHEVDVPFDRVDIAGWLTTLPDAEYQRCAPGDHKAAGYTVADDGTPMSINVEMIGTGLVVQHYRMETAEAHHCHLVSTSDVLTPNGWTTVQVVWDLRMEQLDGDRCRYTNSVTSHPTEQFLQFIGEHGISFEQAAHDRQAASGAHNQRETPLFAESIARAARAR